MDYEKMWKDLKAKIEKDLQFYEDGTMCSMMEAAQGVMHCSAMLKEMEAIEDTCSRDEWGNLRQMCVHYAKYEGVHLGLQGFSLL